MACEVDILNKNSNAQPPGWEEPVTLTGQRSLSELSDICFPLFQSILEQEKLDESMAQQFSEVYLPLANWVASKHVSKPVIIGINGAQGSGKSTLSQILKSFLSAAFNKSVLHLSIDDLYLSRKEREKKASEVHSLFRVRGVPGTHDVARGKKILSSLSNPGSGLNIKIPRFDKAQDDLLPEEQWQEVTEPVDIVLFEGWCVGSQEQHESKLINTVNELEHNEDPEGIWRNHVNQQLAGPYQSLFSYLDYLVMLKVPGMASVFEWRSLQENKLAASQAVTGHATSHIMSPAEISRFIMHYERITQSTLSEMPARADVLLELNKNHQVENFLLKDSL